MKKLLFFLILLPIAAFSQVEPLADLNTTYYCEYSPSISFDGKNLVYMSNSSGNWCLYEAERMGETRWSSPRYLYEINNTVSKKRFVGGCFQSYDGKYLLMSSDRKDGYGNMDILISKDHNGRWGEPKNIGLPINTVHFEGFPSLSTDGKELYFIRNFIPGSEPKADRYFLYVSKKDEDGRWGEPRLLPDEINRYKVECPRILPNGRSLLFASIRPEGYGGFDIYQSDKLPNGKWSKPRNLETLNSPFDDNTFTVDGSGVIMYFARTENGIDNLYSAIVPKIEEQSTTLLLKGKVFDSKTYEVIPAEVKLIKADTKATIEALSTSDTVPEYSVFLERGNNLIIEASSQGYSFGSENLFLKSPTLDVEETQGNRMELRDIFGQLILDDEDRQVIGEAFILTEEANALLIGDMVSNNSKIKELQDKSLKAVDSKTMKKHLKKIEKLKTENQSLENQATEKYRTANQSFLTILSKYIDQYKIATNEKIAALGEKLEDEAAELWFLAKDKRAYADKTKSNVSIVKAHTIAKDLEDDAIRKYALAFEYYLQYLNFNKSIIVKNIFLDPLIKDASIVLKNVQFDFNKDQPKESSIDELNKVYQLLTDNPDLKIELSAHTDSIGSDEYNLDLSHRRAMSVMSWLVEKNISINRLSYVGYGESKPLLPNNSQYNMSINRRVEFKIIEN